MIGASLGGTPHLPADPGIVETDGEYLVKAGSAANGNVSGEPAAGHGGVGAGGMSSSFRSE